MLRYIAVCQFLKAHCVRSGEPQIQCLLVLMHFIVRPLPLWRLAEGGQGRILLIRLRYSFNLLR